MKVITCAAAAALILSTGASAQMWDEAQSEVWSAVSAAWAAHVSDGDWHESVHESGYGWGSGAFPAGRDRAAMAAVNAALPPQDEVLHHELAPMKIVVVGDTAMAFYYASIFSADDEGERSTEVEKCADTLVREGDGWVFLGWGCQTLDTD